MNRVFLLPTPIMEGSLPPPELTHGLPLVAARGRKGKPEALHAVTGQEQDAAQDEARQAAAAAAAAAAWDCQRQGGTPSLHHHRNNARKANLI